MRLTNKFILIYLLVSFFVFIGGGIISYYMFSGVVDQETDNEISGQTMQLVKFIENDIPLAVINEDHEITVKVLTDKHLFSEAKWFYDTMALFGPEQVLIHHRKVKQITKINEQWYQIEIHNSLLEPDDTIYGTFISTSVIYLILVVISFLISFILSKLLLQPFNNALAQIEKFDIQKGIGFKSTKVNTLEFEKLNQFLEKMTDRAIKDYRNLREFSENTAHEIKTPLAIANGKLDLLLQTKNLNDKQLELVTDAQNSIKKISKIQSTLSILSKIENEEFNQHEKVNFTELVNNICENHSDLIEFKRIALTTELGSNVMLQNDPVLLEMLFNNLLQNAIRHNQEKGGFIRIVLNEEGLTVLNSGRTISTSSQNLLERFQKDTSNSESLGLGLSIVNKICDRSRYILSYIFMSEEKTHELKVLFQTSD